MEKTQTGQFKVPSRINHKLDMFRQATVSLGLRYLRPEAFADRPATEKDKVLGAIAFGSARPHLPSTDFPFVWIDMPLIHDNTILEVWTSEKPVVREESDGISTSCDGDFLFGCLEVDEDGNLDAASHFAYCRIFDFIDSRRYPHLLRVWNYFPRINTETGGLERYRSFSVGRHDAFVAKGRNIGTNQVPAACALGTQGGPLAIYFLAASSPGQPIENPRQTSAYNYPAQYGPRSPMFSRAMVAHAAEQSPLFISGTASIVGHATLHIGNVSAQAKETVNNIRAVMDNAALLGSHAPGDGTNLLLKVYVRHQEDVPIVQDQVLRAFGPTTQAVYLLADICRADLLLEIEGVCLRQFDR